MSISSTTEITSTIIGRKL